ncbi:MAG: LysM peptidoglycan-binding domain-containing protein [Anaerolineae bacterium]
MASSFKICPICGARNHPNAVVCTTCGTSMADVAPVTRNGGARSARNDYDRRYGETDLVEAEAPRPAGITLMGLLLLLPIVFCAGILTVLAMQSLAARLPTSIPSSATPSPVGTLPSVDSVESAITATSTIELNLATNTPYPTPRLATITPAPPSPTATFTPGPCEKRVAAGDSLITLAFACGHRSMDVMPEILELNHMSSPEELIAGQLIYIPWPTPTVDPNAASANLAGTQAIDPTALAASGGNVEVALADQVFQEALPSPTETMIPGVMWHTVQPEQSMVAIAYQYHTTAEVLAQLNPEITFSQCDYGLDTGGASCTVFLVVGQQMRVPAPTPTATIPPTLSGSETPTPTPTATFNAPSLLSPSDHALFMRADLVTLRWVPTGPLAQNESYLVTLQDLTVNVTYTDFTTQLYYIVPQNVQGTEARRHDYSWTISVVRDHDPATARFVTLPRTFTWEGLTEPTPTGEMN